MVLNSFCTNIVMLHIKSKVMKSRIQWCKTFTLRACLGVTGGQKVGFSVLVFIVTELLLGIRNFDVTPGARDRGRGCGPEGSKSILFKHNHVAYQIGSYEE